MNSTFLVQDTFPGGGNINKTMEQLNATSQEEDVSAFDEDCQHIFPQRLMNILANDKNHDAICWLPHGRAFIIRNRKIFAEKIMPRFFARKSKYSSFTRKLNRWNFVRVSSGPEIGAYYHEFFLRDKPHLAAQMFCKNARTMIAMANDTPKAPPPPAQTSSVPPKMAQQQPPTFQATLQSMQKQQQQQAQSMPGLSVKEADAATDLYLRNQQLDPAMSFLLNQQLNLGQPKQQQMQQQQLPAQQMPSQQQMQQQMPMMAAPLQQQPSQVNPQAFLQSQQQPQQQQQALSQFSFQNPSPLVPEPTPILAYGDGTKILPSSSAAGLHLMNESINSIFNSNNGNNNAMNTNTNMNDNGDLNLWQQIQAQKQQEAQMAQLRQLMAMNLQRQQKRKSGAKNFRASAA